MKRNKLTRGIALLAACAMLLAMTACGGGTATSSSTPADSAGTATAGSAAPAGDGPVLKIGALFNQTGWFATYDYNNVLEMQCLADYYNEQGGVDIGGTKYQLEVVVQDGQSDAEGIRSAAQLLAADKDIHYVVETNDFWVEGALDIFEQGSILNVMAQNNMDFNAINSNLKYAYTFSNGCAAQFSAALEFVSKTYPDVKSIVFTCDDNGVTNFQADLVKSLCGKYGLTYVDAPVVYDATSTDFSAIALQLMNTGADAFIGNGDFTNSGAILKEIRNNGSDMLGCSIVGANASLLQAASGLSDLSRAFTMGSDLATPENNTEIFNTIYEKFKKDYGEETAASWCGVGVNGMYTLLQLLQDAGTVDVAEVQKYYDGASNIETLFGTGVICGTETYGNNHVVAHPNSVTYLDGGKVVYGGTFACSVP